MTEITDVDKILTNTAPSSIDLRKILIELDITNFLNSMEKAEEELFNGRQGNLGRAQARLKTHVRRIAPLLRRRLDKEQYLTLSNLLYAKRATSEDLEICYNIVSDLLDEIGLTKIDIKRQLPKDVVSRMNTYLGGQDVE